VTSADKVKEKGLTDDGPTQPSPVSPFFPAAGAFAPGGVGGGIFVPGGGIAPPAVDPNPAPANPPPAPGGAAPPAPAPVPPSIEKK